MEARTTKRIVVATDGSAGAREAVQTGLELARAAGAIATVVFVRTPTPTVVGRFSSPGPAAELHSARAIVDEALSRAALAGVEAESEILEGDPATEILRLAQRRDAGLIVVGSRGLDRIAGILLGSVSSAVVGRADRPVLVVKPAVSKTQRAA